MNYILFVSNKESVNPYYVAAWKNVAASNELNESNIKQSLYDLYRYSRQATCR